MSKRAVMSAPRARSPVEDGPAFEDVRRAAELLRGVVLETPVIPSGELSRLCNGEVFLKLENLQRDGSVKLRGAYIQLVKAANAREAVAAPAGNHALGVARAAALLGLRATVVVPAPTPYPKIRRIEALGARVLTRGESAAAAVAEARAMADAEHCVFVPSHDDPALVAGGGTAGLELLSAVRGLDVLVVPACSGALACGVALAAKALEPNVKVIAVGAKAVPSLRNALAGRPAPEPAPTLADGISSTELGALDVALARSLVDEVLLVEESSLETAMHYVLDRERCVAEGAGAAAVAALIEHRGRFGGKRIGAIVSGGNVDAGLLSSVVARERLRDGRVARLRIFMFDGPGGLAAVAATIAACGANILDVSHHRTFPDVPEKAMQLDVTIETRRPSDLLDVLERLRDQGFKTTLPDAGVIA